MGEERTGRESSENSKRRRRIIYTEGEGVKGRVREGEGDRRR